MHIAILLFVSSALAGDMTGDCKQYKLDVSQELNLWDTKPASVLAGAPVPVQQKLQFQLQDQKQIKFPANPEKLLIKNGQAYGGTFLIKPARTAIHQVALAKRAWLDVVDQETNTIVKSDAHDMQTKCDKLVKVVAYNLVAGKTYILQINSSPLDKIEGTITAR